MKLFRLAALPNIALQYRKIGRAVNVQAIPEATAIAQPALWALLRAQLGDPASHWGLGSFGAIAEFLRDPEEEAFLDFSEAALSVVTRRGGILVSQHSQMRAVAFETPAGSTWSQSIALCLPAGAAGMSGRSVLTELGPDHGALRSEDRVGLLFDLGLDIPHVDASIRVANPEVAAQLREFCGRNVFEAGNTVMAVVLAFQPHRVFSSKFGRIEVYQPIPPPDGRSPQGPHTHVLPKLLKHGLTHAATDPIPADLVPCLSLYPAHPCKDALGEITPFNVARHNAFQSLFRAYGDPATVALKERVFAALANGEPPSLMLGDRFSRAAVRVTLRQAKATAVDPTSLASWLQEFERPGVRDQDNSCH